MHIYMTSFFKASETIPAEVEVFSAAVYQPKGFRYQKIDWTDIRRDGKWTRPREFLDTPDPALAYWESMLDLYRSREDEAREWFKSRLGRPAALCCWCPYDKAAQRQLGEFGTFICHTGPLGQFIAEQGHKVWHDYDRRCMYHPNTTLTES